MHRNISHRYERVGLLILLALLLMPGTGTAQEEQEGADAPVVEETETSENAQKKGTDDTTEEMPIRSVSLLDLILSLMIVAAGLMAAFLIHRLFSWLGEMARQSSYNIDGIVLKILGPPLSVLVASVPIIYALRRIPEIRHRFERWDGAETAVWILIGTWVLASLVKKLILHYGVPLARNTETTFDERLLHILDLTAVYVIWAMGILVALRALGIQITAFLASMGIVGLAVALAAKSVLSNMLGGITLTADPYLNMGDRIEVKDYIGDVVNINLYKTTIRTRDNKMVSIPNDVLVKEVVINHELPEARTRLSLSFGVSYNSDLERVTEVVRAIVDSDERILDEPEPEVNLVEFGDSAVNFQVLVWLGKPRGRRKVRDDVYRSIFRRFREEGIEIPFPQRVVHQSGD